MKIYVAAMYSKRIEVREHHARILQEAGHEVTARWLWEGGLPGSEVASAFKDIEDVARADALVLVTNPIGTNFSGGGRCVEMGYAMAAGKLVIVVGERENIFCWHPDVFVVASMEMVLMTLDALKDSRRPTMARRMMNWCHRTFGDVALEPKERAARLVEEVVELGQTQGLQLHDLDRIMWRVYGRLVGKTKQEIGQVHNLLHCLAENLGLDAEQLGREEFARCQAVPQEEWDRRHAAKVAAGTAAIQS